jgi:hypothetical protein
MVHTARPWERRRRPSAPHDTRPPRTAAPRSSYSPRAAPRTLALPLHTFSIASIYNMHMMAGAGGRVRAHRRSSGGTGHEGRHGRVGVRRRQRHRSGPGVDRRAPTPVPVLRRSRRVLGCERLGPRSRAEMRCGRAGALPAPVHTATTDRHDHYALRYHLEGGTNGTDRASSKAKPKPSFPSYINTRRKRGRRKT